MASTDKHSDLMEEAAETERGNWSSKFEALLSYIGYCVGLGNVWRFPYLCYRNGGGAFLIPYFLMMLLAGLPLYFLELSLGQYGSYGASTVWKFSPIFKGVGYTAVMASGLCCVYYNQIIAYVLFYLFASMTSELPWTTCGNSWNTPACRIRTRSNTSDISVNTTATQSYVDQTATSAYHELYNTSLTPKSPGEEYWERYVLNMSDGISNPGYIQWKLALSLFLAWVLVFLCLIKGIKTTGKVVYVTATFPYVVLTILLVRGLTLPGAMDGLLFYLVPDFSKLAKARVWGDAASQIFYSLGPAWGILITYSSYNKFNHNSQRDALISSFVCTGTSVFAGLVIFSVLGFISHELQTPIENVMSSGPGLVFVVYPEALAQMPIAPLWAVIFFLMLLTISLDSMFATFETVISAIVDEFPGLLMKRRTMFTAFLSAVFFLLGLPQATQAGIYILTLFDWYVGTFPPLIVGLFEVIIISYIYGYRRFAADIKLMMGFSPGIYWQATWMFLAPLAMLFIIVFNGVIYAPVKLGDYNYPKWAEMMGWGLSAASLVCIPLFAIGVFFYKIGGIQNIASTLSLPWTGETLALMVRPEYDWAPAHVRRDRQNAQELSSYPNYGYKKVLKNDTAVVTVDVSKDNYLLPQDS